MSRVPTHELLSRARERAERMQRARYEAYEPPRSLFLLETPEPWRVAQSQGNRPSRYETRCTHFLFK